MVSRVTFGYQNGPSLPTVDKLGTQNWSEGSYLARFSNLDITSVLSALTLTPTALLASLLVKSLVGIECAALLTLGAHAQRGLRCLTLCLRKVLLNAVSCRSLCMAQSRGYSTQHYSTTLSLFRPSWARESFVSTPRHQTVDAELHYTGRPCVVECCAQSSPSC